MRGGKAPRGLSLAAAVALTMAACGGDSPPPPVTPTPPPPPPPPRVVAQGAGSLRASFVTRVVFSTSLPGSLEATVDWTFASNDVDVALVRGDCSFEQLEAMQCPVVAFSISATAKPERIRGDAGTVGPYTLFIENVGPTDESLSYQVVLTPTASATSASAAREGAAPLGRKRAVRGFAELR